MKKNTGNSIKKITLAVLLLLIREIYFALKNILGLVYHPFKTIKEIRLKKDISQATLITSIISLPITTATVISILYIIGKHLLNFPVPSFLGLLLKVTITALTVFTLSIFIYIAFWTLKVIRKDETSQKTCLSAKTILALDQKN